MGCGRIGTWARTLLCSTITSHTAFFPVSPCCPAIIHWAKAFWTNITVKVMFPIFSFQPLFTEQIHFYILLKVLFPRYVAKFFHERYLLCQILLAKIFLPGQRTSSLQFWVISFGPAHLFPPWAVGGLVHERERFCVPFPQVALHWSQSPHGVQPPFT